MKLPIAIAAIVLAVTSALPAAASAPTGHYFYSHQSGYRAGARAYAAAIHHPRSVADGGWGHCVSHGLEEGARSAFPSRDVC